MKTTSFAIVVALTFALVRPAFAQRVIGNTYPDSTDSQASRAGRGPGNSADFGPYALSEPDLAPAPRDVYSEPAPNAGSLSKGFVAPESSDQRVIGNIYPDSTDSEESPGVRDPGRYSDFGPYSPSDTDLAAVPSEYAEPHSAPLLVSYSEGFGDPPSKGGFA